MCAHSTKLNICRKNGRCETFTCVCMSVSEAAGCKASHSFTKVESVPRFSVLGSFGGEYCKYDFIGFVELCLLCFNYIRML